MLYYDVSKVIAMKKEHYSVEHIKIIKKCIKEERYLKALKEFDLYFNNFPKDSIAMLNYVDLLIKLGRFSEADQIIKNIPNLANFNRSNKNFYYVLLIKLRCYQNKFDQAKDLLDESILLRDYSSDVYINFLDKLYILKQLDIDVIVNYNSYIINQVLNYQESKFFEHIEKHLCNSISNNAKFYSEFPLNDIYHVIKKMLPTNNRICQSIVCYHEIFKYDCCGEHNGNTTNYFTVVAINSTNDIITMFPCSPKELIGFTDLNYIKDNIYEEKNIDNNKVKILSQIEKFNKRYKK